MTRLDRYIYKNFIKSILLSLIAFINIFILSQLFKVIRYVTEGRMTIIESITYILYRLPKTFIEVMPLAILLGALMSMNKMASNLEIISMKTSGISFKRIVRYPLMISFLISMIVFQIMGTIYPKALAKSNDLREGRETKKEVELPKVRTEAFLRTTENIIYYIKKVDRVNAKAEFLEIIKLDKNFKNIEEIITAKEGVFNFENQSWDLKEVTIIDPKLETENKLETYTDKSLNKEPKEFMSIMTNPKELTNKEIRKSVKNIVLTGGSIKESLAELGERYSFPFASFIVAFLGLSLGSRYVRGTSAASIGLSVVLGYGYYIVKASFETLGENGILNPFVAGWIPNIIFIILGVYFMKKAEY